MKAIQLVQNEFSKSYRDVNFEVGDTVKVHYRIIEGDKERIQVYEGIVIAIDNKGISKTFTVRRISYDVGVERIFPLHSPRIEKITVVRKGKKRRAKLYFLRERTGKSAKLKEVRSRKKAIETPATHEVVDNSENTETNA
ncbi:MAG TPA: 50S ribosomal protein L19 [Spirochaetota bacterium]|nr:50S ribosomal protein L19 [Spirochaetota bacterium]HOM09643.1 50S ribosomal protein L19 [Spirochaetota bacterium]HPP50596.1 50S ribosomal protein L19 [Spirochaetota bacterium]HXK66676.1 50S ribosomal protein L19 [Spirochaetota bacterium]